MNAWRRVIALAVALATLAAVPMLAAPWDEDEVFLVGAVRGTSPWMNTRFDAYRFSSGEPAEVAARVASGVFPWYVAPDFKYALFRPLTSALLWVDATVFGDHRVGFQLHALAWHAALVVAAGLMLRRAIPGRVGQAALLLFAVSVVHTTPTAWLTARHVLVATVPVLFGLVAHVRLREDGWRPGLPLSVAAFAVGLLGSEAAAQALAFVVAYEVAGRPGRSVRQMLEGLAPAAAVVGAYAVLYVALGRGHAYGSALLESVSGLLTTGLPRLAVHAAVLLGLSVRPDNAWGYDALRPTMLVALPLVLLAPRAVRALVPEERRGVTWLALGSVLALVPVLGAPLESRVLVAPSLGAAAVVAALLRAGIVALRERLSSVWGRVLVALGAAPVLLVHAVIGPVELPQHYLAMSRARERRLGAFLRATPPDRGGRDVLVIGAPHFLYGQLGGYLRARMNGTGVASATGAAGRWVPVADANCAHRVARTGPDRVEIEPLCPDRFFPYGRLERGDEVKQLRWTVRVVEGHPRARFEVRFAGPIEEAGVSFVAFEGFVDRELPLPALGEVRLVPQPAPPELNAIDPATAWLHARFEP